jgi:hypothetical protein
VLFHLRKVIGVDSVADGFICASGWLFLFAVCLNLFLDHVIIGSIPSFSLNGLMRFTINIIDLIIFLLLDICWLLSPLVIKVILHGLWIRKIN